MLLKIVPQNPNLNPTKYAVLALIFSALLIVGSFGLVFTKGLNFGIDFTGGTLVEVATPEPADLADLRAKLNALNLGETNIQEFGEPTELLIRIQAQEDEQNPQQQKQMIADIQQILPEGTQVRRVEFVGPTVGEELKQKGTYAVIYALLAIMVYIWLRFEWQFGTGAVLALAHDIILTMGFFSLIQKDFNLSTVAAILTIAGYSINDTVIIYDRIREEMRKYKKMPLNELINMSVNRTLSRTFLTSVTTIIALIALYFLGGEVISSFSLALIWGVCVGTYSTIFIASPFLLYTSLKNRDKAPAAEDSATEDLATS